SEAGPRRYGGPRVRADGDRPAADLARVRTPDHPVRADGPRRAVHGQDRRELLDRLGGPGGPARSVEATEPRRLEDGHRGRVDHHGPPPGTDADEAPGGR